MSCSNLPEGTVAFSAGSHIDLPDDIFYERFPLHLRERAPRVWFEEGISNIGQDGKSFLSMELVAPLAQYDLLPGAVTSQLDARVSDKSDDSASSAASFPKYYGCPAANARNRFPLRM